MAEAYIGIKVFRPDNPIYDQYGIDSQWNVLTDGTLLVHDPLGTKEQLIERPLSPPNPGPRTPRWFAYAPGDWANIEAIDGPNPGLSRTGQGAASHG